MPTAEFLLQMLLRSTILLAVGYLLIWTGLKICRVTSPRLHRLGWLVALLTGWLGSGIQIDVLWKHKAEPTPWSPCMNRCTGPGCCPVSRVADLRCVSGACSNSINDKSSRILP